MAIWHNKYVKYVLICFCILYSVSFTASAKAADSLEDFTLRLAEAFAEGDKSARTQRIQTLFYPAGLDEETAKLMERSSRYLANIERPEVAFEAVPDDAEFLNVLDGYEYTPNLVPEGYVVLTKPGAEPGNHTRIPYGRRPEDGLYLFPAMTRKLVNPDAEPDKQLQMLAMGIGHPALTFEGWCDLALSNGTTKRITLEDQGIGNQTRIYRGQKILACDITNTSGRDRLSLILMEDETTIFEGAVEFPETKITYSP